MNLGFLSMFINSSQVGGWARAFVAGALGVAISKWPLLGQYVDATTQGYIGAAAAGVAVAIWSHLSKPTNTATTLATPLVAPIPPKK